jgi:ABC-type multidrug transport system fused ATPase/permease subunit
MTTATAERKSLKAREQAAGKLIEKGGDSGKILQRLLFYMAGEKARPKFIGALILRFFALCGLIAIPYLTGEGINVVGNPNGTIAELQRFIIPALIAGGFYLLLSFLADRMFSDLATKALFKLQNSLFAHMQTLALSFFDRQPLGELMSRLTNDTEVISLFYESAVSQMIRELVQIILTLVVMLLMDWRLTIVALLVVPIMLYLMNVVTRIATPAFDKLQEDLGTLSGFQEETLSGNKVIISNRRHEWSEEVNMEYAASAFDTGNKAFFNSLVQYPLTQSLIYIQIVLVLVAGSVLVIEGETELGTVIAFSGYAALLSKPLSNISSLISTALNGLSGGRRVFKIIDEEATVKDTPDAVDYEFKGGHIQCTDVDFSYIPGRKILRHNTFEVQPGESIGICGPTGAGKSTLINILTRYYDINGGTILIDGQDLTKLTQTSLRRQIGVVLQEAFLFTDTVMNNLKYAREGATEEECIEAAKQANAHDFIMHLPQGYDTMLTERGANLSQGQRQMITIARAMVADPKLMILDEATSNVDTRTEKLIQDGLRKLMEGKTSFSIAHRLATIRDSAKIMVLNGGEIVEYAPHDELMADKSFYYALYMSQFKGKAPGGVQSTDVDFIST